MNDTSMNCLHIGIEFSRLNSRHLAALTIVNLICHRQYISHVCFDQDESDDKYHLQTDLCVKQIRLNDRSICSEFIHGLVLWKELFTSKNIKIFFIIFDTFFMLHNYDTWNWSLY